MPMITLRMYASIADVVGEPKTSGKEARFFGSELPKTIRAARRLLGPSEGNAGPNQGGNLPHWMARQLSHALDVPIRRSPAAGFELHANGAANPARGKGR
jgi:hypothetical protein